MAQTSVCLVRAVPLVVLGVAILVGVVIPSCNAQFQTLNQIPVGLLEHLKRVPQLWNVTSTTDQACLNQLDVFASSFDAGEPWALSSE